MRGRARESKNALSQSCWRVECVGERRERVLVNQIYFASPPNRWQGAINSGNYRMERREASVHGQSTGRPKFSVRERKILVGHREATERPQLEGGAETHKSRSGIFGGV